MDMKSAYIFGLLQALGFCENCWSTCYVETVNGRKVKHNFEETAFIDPAGKHDVVRPLPTGFTEAR